MPIWSTCRSSAKPAWSRRGAAQAGAPAPIPFGPIVAPHGSQDGLVVGELATTASDTIMLRGPMVPRHNFPRGVERSDQPHFAIGGDGLVDDRLSVPGRCHRQDRGGHRRRPPASSVSAAIASRSAAFWRRSGVSTATLRSRRAGSGARATSDRQRLRSPRHAGRARRGRSQSARRCAAFVAGNRHRGSAIS